MTAAELDAKAAKMRAENKDAIDNLFDALRRAGKLLEFPPEEWDAYMAKHYGPGSKPALVRTEADPKDLRWKDYHKNLDIYEPEPDV